VALIPMIVAGSATGGGTAGGGVDRASFALTN
jgi:hypothetical protein